MIVTLFPKILSWIKLRKDYAGEQNNKYFIWTFNTNGERIKKDVAEIKNGYGILDETIYFEYTKAHPFRILLPNGEPMDVNELFKSPDEFN